MKEQGVPEQKTCFPDSDDTAVRVAAARGLDLWPRASLLSPFQEAIQHSSFFEPERKLEYGNVDEAFKGVDQILEGKAL